jgi:hypothetical protein
MKEKFHESYGIAGAGFQIPGQAGRDRISTFARTEGTE